MNVRRKVLDRFIFGALDEKIPGGMHLYGQEPFVGFQDIRQWLASIFDFNLQFFKDIRHAQLICAGLAGGNMSPCV